MNRCALAIPLLLTASAVIAETMPVVPYDTEMEIRVLADGQVEREEDYREYPFEFVDNATGMTVSWGYDDYHIYVALETKGRGWFGIGFGTPGMNGSNMVVGYDTDEDMDVVCLVGRGHSHVEAGFAEDLLVDWDVFFNDETGVTTIEFAYPLFWQGEQAPEDLAGNEVLQSAAIPGLVPGGVYDMILAQNTRTASLDAKHTHISSLKFMMAEKPDPTPGEED